MERGIVYVAYGANARIQASMSMATLRRYTALPIACVSDNPLPAARHVYHPDADPGGRLAKLSLDTLSPYEHTLYLDADTRVKGDIGIGFEVLADGWDVAIVPSTRQGGDVLGNCTEEDRALTRETLDEPLGLQAGVMFFRKVPRVVALFAAWREEWARFRTMDQAALLRALWRVPVHIWLLGRAFNGGALLEHHFGRARR